jgi:hypothetical protein
MSVLFVLIEQLAGLTAPSVLALQSLLHVTLLQVPNTNTYYSFYEERSDLASIGKVDLRLPRSKATKGGAFLVVDFRGVPISLQDFEKRFGRAQITDPSHHHPHFVGYSITVAGRKVGVTADSLTNTVESISIDYSEPPNNLSSGRPHTARRR